MTGVKFLLRVTLRRHDLAAEIYHLKVSGRANWGKLDEAIAMIEKARADDRPIFLSVGYSTCHWCHVMERESFEDEATAAELNALASVSVIDIYRRVFKPGKSDRHYLRVSKIVSVFWGAYAIGFAMFANSLGSLIEAVNILGSLFYGAILGIFIIAFSFKKIGGDATFIAAIIASAISWVPTAVGSSRVGLRS